MSAVDTVVRARRGLAVYFAVLVPGTVAIERQMILARGAIDEHPGLVFALMWLPALASIVARVVLREGIRDVSLRPRGIGAIATAWVFPFFVGILAYGTAWATGLARFTSAGTVTLVAAAGVGPFLECIPAAGEELGWRGYMLTRLFDAGVPRPVLVGGVVWGLWHVPLIVTGQYAAGPSPLLSVCVFMVNVVAFSYFVARLRLVTGSVLPAVVAHGAWNGIIQGVFDASTESPGIWLGESGLLVTIVALATVALLVRRPFQARRSPADEPFAEVRAWSV